MSSQDTFVKGALNLPAHSFYPTRSTIVTVLSQIPIVIFHCSSCSETGRGSRTAGWYREELQKQGVAVTQTVWVLDGGIKQFSALYGEDSALVSKV
jgi:arsenical-resistance protein 2